VIYAGEPVDLPALHPPLYRQVQEAAPAQESEADVVWSAAGCPDVGRTPVRLPFKLAPAAPSLASAETAPPDDWFEPQRLARTLLALKEEINMPIYIKGLERALIDRAIDRCNGSVSGAARVLRTNRTTIIAKLKRSG